MRAAPLVLTVIAAVAVVEVAVNLLMRPQTGPFALAAVFETQLLAVGAVAGALALLVTLGDGGAGVTRVRLVGLAVVVLAVVRLGGEWWSPGAGPAAGFGPGATRLTVLSWNLEVGSRASATTVDALVALEDAAAPPDVIALQELTPAVSDAIDAEPRLTARYPYRILVPQAGVSGMGLLSRLPLVKNGSWTEPLILRAGVLLEDGSRIDVLDVHPFPPTISTLGGVPIGVDTRRRDEDLGVIAAVATSLDDPARTIVIGDLNTTPFEPGFGRFAELRDAHAEAATGTGFTWRPGPLEGLNIGLLRIDHVLSGSSIAPVQVREDCVLEGDHCRLFVTLLVAPAG